MLLKRRLNFFLTDDLVLGMLNEDQKKTRELSHIIEKNCMVYLSEHDSKDVAQDVQLEIFKKKEIIQNCPFPGAYATKINKGKLIDMLRKLDRESKVICPASLGFGADSLMTDDSSEISSNDRTQADILEHNNLYKLIEKIGKTARIASLRKGWIALKYSINGFSYSDIAKKMGVNESTVKSWIHRFRVYLRSELLKYGWDRIELNKAMGF